MKMCLKILKVERKNRTEVHVYAHDQCQANYRKRGSASYIVREVLSVRERERYRERERERETEVTSFSR